MKINLTVLGYELSACKYATVPEGLLEREICFIARDGDGLSVVCETALVGEGATDREDGWRALKVTGPLNFGLVGILSRIASALADAGVPIYAVSTYDTDYVLVKQDKLEDAIAALRNTGCKVTR